MREHDGIDSLSFRLLGVCRRGWTWMVGRKEERHTQEGRVGKRECVRVLLQGNNFAVKASTHPTHQRRIPLPPPRPSAHTHTDVGPTHTPNHVFISNGDAVNSDNVIALEQRAALARF